MTGLERERFLLEEVMSIREACERYNVKRTTLRNYITGKAPRNCNPDVEIDAGRLRYYELPGSDRREWYVTDAFMQRYFGEQ